MLSLERAKSALLEINLYMGAPGGIRKDPQFLDLLTSRFQNTETLRVTHLWTTEDLFLFSRHPMTNLRSLALEGQWQGDCDRSIDRSVRVVSLCSAIPQIACGPTLSFLPQHQNSHGVGTLRLLLQSPLGHAFGLFGGEPLTHEYETTDPVYGTLPP